jgi:hypothetical protein
MPKSSRFSVFREIGLPKPDASKPVEGATLPSRQANEEGLPLLPSGGVIRRGPKNKERSRSDDHIPNGMGCSG